MEPIPKRGRSRRWGSPGALFLRLVAVVRGVEGDEDWSACDPCSGLPDRLAGAPGRRPPVCHGDDRGLLDARGDSRAGHSGGVGGGPAVVGMVSRGFFWADLAG